MISLTWDWNLVMIVVIYLVCKNHLVDLSGEFQIVVAFLPGIKTGRSITVTSVCDFGEAEKMQKVLLLQFW